MSLRIYDTRAGQEGPVRAARCPARSACTSAASPSTTSPRRARAHAGRLRRDRALPARARATRSPSSATSPTSTTRSSARAEAERRTAARSRATTPRSMNADMRGARRAPADVRAAGHRAHRRDHRDHRAARGAAASPTPAGGDVYFAVGGFAAYGKLSASSIDELQAGARIEVDERKREPARLRAVEGRQAGRAVVGEPVGQGPAGLAHRVLGDGAPLPRRAVRHPRRRRGPHLPAPRERDRPVRGAYGDGHVRALLDAQRLAELRRREDVEVARQLRHHPRGRRARPEALRCSCRRPLPQPGGVQDRARRHGARPLSGDLEAADRARYFYRTLDRLGRRRRARPTAGAVCGRPTRRWPRFDEAMDDDFNTAAAIGHLSEAFPLANKLLDEPRRRAKDVRRRTLARLRKDLPPAARRWESSSARPAAFLRRLSAAPVRRGGDRPADVEARIAERVGRPRGQGLRPRRRDPQARSRSSGVELMDTPAGTTWRVAEPR